MTDERTHAEVRTNELEARLQRVEELLGDLHEWMRSEQVATLPNQYRRLFNHLLSRDFDRRFAARLVQSVHHAAGARELSEQEVRERAVDEINRMITEGRPSGATRRNPDRTVLALVGSSGAGKTTMMYKLAVRHILAGKTVKVISCDTYKIGSVEGVSSIAEILQIPIGVAFEPGDVRRLISESHEDLIIVDTAGRADREARSELAGFLSAADPDQTHLVLSATMSSRAIQETAALYLGHDLDFVTFTKLDEAPTLGSMISSLAWLGLPAGYLSTGTVIPDDLISASEADLGRWAIEGLPQSEHESEASHV